jgi:rhodanese-related sulfurtransferase
MFVLTLPVEYTPAPSIMSAGTQQHSQKQADYVHSVFALNPVVFDVRSDEEWKGGHLSGARHVAVPPPPLAYADMCRLAAQLAEASRGISKDHPVAVYCKKGIRSGLAAALLRAQGMTQVYDLGGATDGPLAEYRKRG